ncbi:MAG TPA: hypothetical protein VJU52_01825 [Flavobacterium sp.]|nr:hypothetical protein [Flavobacterium sp.]
MEKLKFKGVEYTKINITKIPETHLKEIDKLTVIPGDCLGNSHTIAKNITDINIVEGYLVTYFEDESDIESVGHAWNEYKGVYFDKSIELIQHNRKVKKNEHFLATTYTANEVSKEKVYLPPKHVYDLFPEEDHTKSKLVFKTDVKKLEIELKDFLNEE